MTSGSFRLLAFSLIGSVCLLCFEGAATQLGWSPAEANQVAQSFFTNSSADITAFTGWISKPVRLALLGRTGPARAQLAREVALQAKQFVQAPAFAKTHDAWIRESLNAVNHGIKVDAAAQQPEPTMQGAMGQMAAQLMEGMKDMPPEGLKMMVDQEIAGLKRSSNARDKARLDKMLQIQSLMGSQPAEAKKRYVYYLVAKEGGPADDAGIQSAMQDAKHSEAEQKRREQQLNYDKYNLKAQLRTRLDAFIAEAKSVDFNAQTRPLANRKVFANAAYEQKSSSWKLLYRMGREPVMALLAVAEQWRREL